MEINDLLQNAFLKEWNSLSFVRISSHLAAIRTNFLLLNVRNKINEDIQLAIDKTVRERYHRQNLNKLAKLYAQILFRVSNSGTTINSFTINEAAAQLKNHGTCDHYPC